MSEIKEDDFDAFEVHIRPPTDIDNQPNFGAVLAVFGPETSNLETIIGKWQGLEPGVKFHIQATPQEAFESSLHIRLCIRFTDSNADTIHRESADIYLTADIIKSLGLQKLVPAGPNIGATEIHVPQLLDSVCAGAEQWLALGMLWQLDIALLHNTFHASNVFCPRQFGNQADLMNRVRNHLLQQQHLTFYLLASDPTPSITLLNEYLQRDRAGNPLDVWYPAHPGKHFLQVGDYVSAENRPYTSRQAKLSFRTWSEYQTTMGYGVIYEQEQHERIVQALEDQTLSLRFMTIPNAGNRRYLAFLELPLAADVETLELYPGETLKIIFNTDVDESHPDSDWTGTVAEPIITTPPRHVPLMVTRRWDKETGYHTLDPEIQPLEAGAEPNPREASHVLRTQTPYMVRVQVVDSSRPFRAKISALHEMQQVPRSNRSLLLANDFSSLPTTNLFAHLAESPDQAAQQFGFNAEQMEAFRMLQRLVHGMGIIHGPPGTGKTHWLLHSLLPLLLPVPADPAQRRQVMILGPSNNVVDSIAVSMQSLLAARAPAGSNVIVTRLHSLSTEEEIMCQPANLERGPSPTDRPPIIQVIGEAALLEEMSTASLVSNLHDSHVARPGGVSDRRAVHVDLSLGHRMLQLAGIITTSWSDPGTFTGLREYWEQYRAGVEFSEEQSHAFTKLIRELRDATLARADVVVCTPFTASKLSVRQNVHPHVIVVDEAGQLHDSDLWPALAFFNPVGFLLVGDYKQLRPLVFTNEDTNPFAKQLQMSLFGRLKMGGLMDVMFCEQRRMVDTLCGLVSDVFYNSRLRTSAHLPPVVDTVSRQLTQYINGNPFRKQHPLLFLDIGEVQEKRDARGRSTINVSSCAAVFALVTALVTDVGIPAEQITVLTPYRGQLYLYHHLLSMHANVRRVNVYTVDSFQGRENMVVIFDVTASARPQFMGNANRLNVALSRARSAMFIVGGWRQLVRPKTDASRTQQATMLKNVIKYLFDRHLNAPVPKSFQPNIDIAMQFLHGFEESDVPVLPDEGALPGGSWEEGPEDPSAPNRTADGSPPTHGSHEQPPVPPVPANPQGLPATADGEGFNQAAEPGSWSGASSSNPPPAPANPQGLPATADGEGFNQAAEPGSWSGASCSNPPSAW